MTPNVERASKLALVLFGLFIGLAGAELLTRVTNGARYGARPTFQPKDEELGWAPAPNLDHVYYGGDYSMAVVTDADGNRLGRLGSVPADAERVMLLGDSYTFGWGVSTSETYASQLDELLAKQSVRAANLGVSGYGTTQSVLRLERYLRQHPDSELAGIVFLHSHNDPTDNIVFESVRRGLREYVERPRNRGVHLHNLTRLVVSLLGTAADDGAHLLPGGHRDFAWTVGAFETKGGRAIEPGDDPPTGSDEEVMWSAQELVSTYDRKSLTRLQLQLLEESITRVNEIGRSEGVVVVHTAIHTAPEWYTDPIAGMVRAAGNDSDVWWCGVLPVDTEYRGPVMNHHSGSHFTPPLNGYYAHKIAGWLLEGGCT